MLRIAGIPIADDHAREIVTALVGDGDPRALDLATRISICLEFRTISVDLSGPEHTTLLAVLDDSADPFADLRGVLACDRHVRQRR
jgi:hypothetical protein